MSRVESAQHTHTPLNCSGLPLERRHVITTSTPCYCVSLNWAMLAAVTVALTPCFCSLLSYRSQGNERNLRKRAIKKTRPPVSWKSHEPRRAFKRNKDENNSLKTNAKNVRACLVKTSTTYKNIYEFIYGIKPVQAR